MKTLRFCVILMLSLLVIACSKRESKESVASEETAAKTEEVSKGIGVVEEMDLSEEIVSDLVAVGKNAYYEKCSGCHLLGEDREVGPGWAGITNRRSPEWIMNMITNVNVMLEEDEEARKLLDECMTHMPNQKIPIDEARGILEYMRQNDVNMVGVKDKAAK